MKIIREKAKCHDSKHYVIEKDFQKEKRKVEELHRDLEKHERMPMAEAHPIPALRHK
jgi:hypothetical protein